MSADSWSRRHGLMLAYDWCHRCKASCGRGPEGCLGRCTAVRHDVSVSPNNLMAEVPEWCCLDCLMGRLVQAAQKLGKPAYLAGCVVVPFASAAPPITVVLASKLVMQDCFPQAQPYLGQAQYTSHYSSIQSTPACTSGLRPWQYCKCVCIITLSDRLSWQHCK